MIIGRISTPHQREESIEASYEYVERYLHQVYDGPISIIHLGEQASGMVADRQTIRQAEDLIAEGKVDVVMAEDVGRIYRDTRHLLAFVNDTVDAGVRLICPADGLDTASDDWEMILTVATVKHGFAAADAKRRVNRTSLYAFHRGGDVRRVRFGYRKLTKEEASSGQFGPVGLRMAKIEECTPIIREMRDRVLAGHSYEAIADWLNSQGIKPGPYAKSDKWTGQAVINLLRYRLLHGEREMRNVIHQRIRKTGKFKRIKNPRHRVSVINSLTAEVSTIGLLPPTAIMGSVVQNRPYLQTEGGSSSGQIVLAALLVPGGIGVTVFDSEEYCDLKEIAEGLEANASLHFRPFDQCELAVQGLLACQVDELVDRFLELFD